MRAESTYNNYSVYINAALIAAHTSFEETGFRQKDLKFYIELFTNWMESRFDGPGLEIQNTQVSRILENLEKEGLLKKNKEQGKPKYNLLPIGLLEITSRLVSIDLTRQMEDFFFLYHFTCIYSERLYLIIAKSKDFLPSSYELEVRHLLNPQNILTRQMTHIKEEIDKLEARKNEAFQMGEMGERLKRQNTPINEIVRKVSEQYPYQLNNQKSMQDLFSELSLDLRHFELIEAPAIRASTLWSPLLAYYKNYYELLQGLGYNVTAKTKT